MFQQKIQSVNYLRIKTHSTYTLINVNNYLSLLYTNLTRLASGILQTVTQFK